MVFTCEMNSEIFVRNIRLIHLPVKYPLLFPPAGVAKLSLFFSWHVTRMPWSSGNVWFIIQWQITLRDHAYLPNLHFYTFIKAIQSLQGTYLVCQIVRKNTPFLLYGILSPAQKWMGTFPIKPWKMQWMFWTVRCTTVLAAVFTHLIRYIMCVGGCLCEVSFLWVYVDKVNVVSWRMWL